MKSSNYRDRLFELLPQLYHVYDQGDGSLKAFLAAIGETLDDMEQNISELYGDSFIESCHDWVVPYIGQLIGARLIESEGSRSRQEVMKTIHWRKRKGTLGALEDLAREITGWGVQAAEFFEQIGWSQNLNHIKPDHLQSPDMRDEKALFFLGSAENKILHSVDLRKPCGRKGWFQIKNLGFFLSTATLSHYRKVPMRRIFGSPYRFNVEPKRFPVDLFDGESYFPLARTVAPKERFSRFGTGQTVDVFSRGILTATPEMPKWTGSPAVAPTDPSLLDLKNHDGLLPVDWRVGGGEPLKYTLTPMVLFESAGKAKLKDLGHLDLSTSPLLYSRVYDGSKKTRGRLVIKVVPHTGYNRPFPGMVLKLQGHKQEYQVFEGTGDRQRGIYKDRAYVYLPGFCPHGESSFAIDRYGTTYSYQHDGTRAQPDDAALFDFTKVARATEGVVYPSRQLTAATQPTRPVYSLARRRALLAVDRGQFLTPSAPAEGWVVKAWNRDNQPGGGVLRLLSAIGITSVADAPRRTALEDHACEAPGHLLVSLHRETLGWVPEMEIIVTDERGDALIVHLPQVDDLDDDGAFFYVAEDGATYRVNAETIPGGLLVRRGPDAGPDGAFNSDLLARYSAGQVLPIAGKTPIQHRIPVRCDLSETAEVQPGIMAIDPMIGRVAFAKGERPRMPLVASYYHGLSAHLGAGPYFHDWEAADEERIIRVSKRAAPDGCRHVRPPAEGVVSKFTIFPTIESAVTEAIARSAGEAPGASPWVVQIEDSQIYTETFTVTEALPGGLIIRAAQFQFPVWRGRVIWDAPDTSLTPVLAFQGLVLGHTPRIRTGRFGKVLFKDCTLLRNLLILAGVQGEEDRYPALTLDNCIVRGRASIYSHFTLRVTNSAFDTAGIYALAAGRAQAEIERCTVLGRVRVKTLQASESIFMAVVTAINPQEGCIRYSRVVPWGNTLPRSYRCISDSVTFCGNIPWRSDYLKLKRTCNDPATHWAENGGEIGVYHQADYTLKEKNLAIKFEEYLPVGLTPVLIDVGCEIGR